MRKAIVRPGGDGDGAPQQGPEVRGKSDKPIIPSKRMIIRSGGDLDILRRYKRHLRKVALDAGEVPDVDSSVRITPRRPAGSVPDFRSRIIPPVLLPRHDDFDEDEDD